MAKTVRNVDVNTGKELPLMKEWKSSRYFRRTVTQLRTEFRNDSESTVGIPGSNHSLNSDNNGLGSIPGKNVNFIHVEFKKLSNPQHHNVLLIFLYI